MQILRWKLLELVGVFFLKVLEELSIKAAILIVAKVMCMVTLWLLAEF